MSVSTLKLPLSLAQGMQNRQSIARKEAQSVPREARCILYEVGGCGKSSDHGRKEHVLLGHLLLVLELLFQHTKGQDEPRWPQSQRVAC